MDYDVIIIGAGCAGMAAAERIRKAGLSVCVVESRDVGGTCLNRGCIPTKTLLHSAMLLDEARRDGPDYGILADNLHFDPIRLTAWKNTVVETLRNGKTALLTKAGVVLERGNARVEASGVVSVTGDNGNKRLTTRAIIVATGTEPARPAFPGGNLPGVWTSDDLLEGAGQFPRRLVVFGAGVIAVEFAFVYNGFGAEVSLIARRQVFARLEREISQTMTAIMKKRGIRIYPQSGIEKVEQSGDALTVTLLDGATIETDGVLVATGRKADGGALFADTCQPVLAADGTLVVDASMRTTVAGVFAAGEIAGGVQLAHAAEADGDYAGERVAAFLTGEAEEANGMPSRRRIVPACVYTKPEVACAGLTADEAKTAGHEVVAGKGIFGTNGKAFLEKQERAFIKLVFDKRDRKLIGAQFLCNHATEMIAWAVQSIEAGLTAADIVDAIFAHPTYSETIKAAAQDAITRGGL
jgi:dihydrolipoamide dehydrogenase